VFSDRSILNNTVAPLVNKKQTSTNIDENYGNRSSAEQDLVLNICSIKLPALNQ